jgi:hypothetical protein
MDEHVGILPNRAGSRGAPSADATQADPRSSTTRAKTAIRQHAEKVCGISLDESSGT